MAAVAGFIHMAALVAGSDYTFASRDVHSLKGVPDEWELLAVT